MSSRQTLYCDNHPDRIALERCEACRKPLCAYCLYYTEDGQRLCAEHAAEARSRGIVVEEPGAYASQLVGAQVGAMRKRKHEFEADDGLYRGNSNDVMAFLGLVLGVTALGACCGIGYCLPGVGFLLSLVALLNAKKAHDVKRTRRFALIGLLASGLWVLVIGACIALYGLSIAQLTNSIQGIPIQNLIPTSTRAPITATLDPDTTPTPTAAPTRNPNDLGAWLPDATAHAQVHMRVVEHHDYTQVIRRH